jgi:hypothetical protein
MDHAGGGVVSYYFALSSTPGLGALGLRNPENVPAATFDTLSQQQQLFLENVSAKDSAPHLDDLAEPMVKGRTPKLEVAGGLAVQYVGEDVTSRRWKTRIP